MQKNLSIEEYAVPDDARSLLAKFERGAATADHKTIEHKTTTSMKTHATSNAEFSNMLHTGRRNSDRPSYNIISGA